MIGAGKKLEKDYPAECAKLIELCGLDDTGSLPHYLNRVYAVTEQKWEENVQRLMKYNVRIKYLMFGEAAPRTLEGEINYFYNNCHGSWGTAIVESLLLPQQVFDGAEQKLDALAQKQFLLVDTMPFPVNFNYPNNYRNKIAYKELVKLCAHSYLRDKLFDPRLQWDSDVKIAFGVKKNAEAMMETFPKGFSLPNGQKVNFSLDFVVTNATNYSHAERIRDVFGINKFR
ncbi:MAG: hypothetical protein H6Q68_774 [Firmicutes bacterium]|nr:hypothetical protein [Bacillota bacterium]